MTTRIWAHRGAPRDMPENTMQSFERALEMGADGIELDVHMCRDGEIVVCHDATVDRTSDGSGRIADMTLAQLKALNFCEGHPDARPEGIPTLREVYRRYGTQLAINVEVKTDAIPYVGIERACLDIARREGVSEAVWYSSFNHNSLHVLRQLDPTAKLGALYMSALYQPWAYATASGFDALHPHYPTLVTPNLVDECRRAGVRLHPWTVDDEATLRACFAMGVDAIITNVPHVARRLRGELQ